MFTMFKNSFLGSHKPDNTPKETNIPHDYIIITSMLPLPKCWKIHLHLLSEYIVVKQIIYIFAKQLQISQYYEKVHYTTNQLFNIDLSFYPLCSHCTTDLPNSTFLRLQRIGTKVCHQYPARFKRVYLVFHLEWLK